MKKTDLKAVKAVALSLLYVEPERDKNIAEIIHHPFLDSWGVQVGEGLEFIEYMKSKEDLEKARKTVSEIFDGFDNVLSYFVLVNKPYSLILFKFVKDYLSEIDYAEMLRFAYQREEMPSKNTSVSISEITEWFCKAQTELLMDDEENEIYEKYDDSLIIYRGVRDKNTKIESISWTTNIEVARLFQKMQGNGRLFQAKICKINTFAYWGGGEQEIICDPNKLNDIVEIL
jgi:hypothetical protein